MEQPVIEAQLTAVMGSKFSEKDVAILFDVDVQLLPDEPASQVQLLPVEHVPRLLHADVQLWPTPRYPMANCLPGVSQIMRMYPLNEFLTLIDTRYQPFPYAAAS